MWRAGSNRVRRREDKGEAHMSLRPGQRPAAFGPIWNGRKKTRLKRFTAETAQREDVTSLESHRRLQWRRSPSLSCLSSTWAPLSSSPRGSLNTGPLLICRRYPSTKRPSQRPLLHLGWPPPLENVLGPREVTQSQVEEAGGRRLRVLCESGKQASF